MYNVCVNGKYVVQWDSSHGWHTSADGPRCKFTLAELGYFIVKYHDTLAQCEVLIETV